MDSEHTPPGLNEVLVLSVRLLVLPMMALILGWHAASRSFSRCGRPVAWWLNTDSTSAGTHLHRLTDIYPRPGGERRHKLRKGERLWHNVATRWSALLKSNNQLLHSSLCPLVLLIWSCIKRHLYSRHVQHRETHTKLHRWKLHSVSASTITTHWFSYPLPSNSICSVGQQVIDDSAQAGETWFKSLGVHHIHTAHPKPLTAIFSVIADFCLSLRSCSIMDSWSWLRICVAA